MKKHLSLLAALLACVLLALSACTFAGTPNDTTDPNDIMTTPKATEPAATTPAETTPAATTPLETSPAETTEPEITVVNPENGLVYRLVDNGKHYEICGIQTTASEIKISYYYNDISVIGIADGAFEGCTTLTKITLPTSLKYIGTRAFGNCVNLTNIEYPSNSTQWNGIQKAGDWLYGVPRCTITCKNYLTHP